MNWIGGRPLKIANRRGGRQKILEMIAKSDGINRIGQTTECLPMGISEGDID